MQVSAPRNWAEIIVPLNLTHRGCEIVAYLLMDGRTWQCGTSRRGAGGAAVTTDRRKTADLSWLWLRMGWHFWAARISGFWDNLSGFRFELSVLDKYVKKKHFSYVFSVWNEQQKPSKINSASSSKPESATSRGTNRQLSCHQVGYESSLQITPLQKKPWESNISVKCHGC